MKKRLYSAIAALLASGGLVQGQGYYPQYLAPPAAYGNPYYPRAAYPVMPAAPGMGSPGAIASPGGPQSQGRATVGAVVVDPSSLPPSVPLLITEVPSAPGAPGVPGAPEVHPAVLPSAQPSALPETAAVKNLDRATPTAMTPVLHRRHQPVVTSTQACNTCVPGPASGPICGVPLLHEHVDCHGQPILERERTSQPSGYCMYGRMDFVFYWVDDQNSPTLLRLATPRGVADLSASSLDNGERVGAKTTLGVWLNPCQTVGLEATFLWLANRTPRFVAGTPTVSRPFFNTATGAEDSLVVLGPGTAGTAELSTNFQFYTGEINLRKELCRSCWGHIDLLSGFRYLNLKEGLQVDTTQALGGGSLRTIDQFSTRNDFFGAQLGLDAEFNWGNVYFNPWGKAAVGYVDQSVSIAGARIGTDGAGAVTAAPGGFLALPSNIGTNRQGDLAFVPEFGLNVGYKVTANCRFLAGYSVIMLTNAARPGDQLNRNLNLTQLAPPGGAAPVAAGPLSPFTNGIQEEIFWAQGANFGFEVRW